MKKPSSLRGISGTQPPAKPEHRKAFRLAVKEQFGPACDTHKIDPSAPWPAALRVKPVRNAAGVLEMTWSFAGPDGRATFELITVDDDLRCRWWEQDDDVLIADLLRIEGAFLSGRAAGQD